MKLRTHRLLRFADCFVSDTDTFTATDTDTFAEHCSLCSQALRTFL